MSAQPHHISLGHPFAGELVGASGGGDKEPSLGAQIELENATGGKVKPSDWLAWSISRRERGPEPKADAA